MSVRLRLGSEKGWVLLQEREERITLLRVAERRGDRKGLEQDPFLVGRVSKGMERKLSAGFSDHLVDKGNGGGKFKGARLLNMGGGGGGWGGGGWWVCGEKNNRPRAWIVDQTIPTSRWRTEI